MKMISRVLILCLLVTNSLQAQGLRSGNAWVGKTYAVSTPNADEQILLRQADYHYSMGDFERATILLDEAVNLNPNSPQALLRRATLNRVFELDALAEADVKRAYLYNPFAADLFGYNGGGGVLNVLATEPLRSAVSLNKYNRLQYYYPLLDSIYLSVVPDNKEPELMEEIIVEIESGEYDAALNLTDALLNTYPESAVGYDLKGIILLKQEKYEEAREAFNEAVILQPGFAVAWYNLSRVETLTGDNTAAKAHLDKAILLQENLTKAYFDRALLNKKTGNPQAALSDYDKVIQLRGDFYPEAYLNRGLTRKMLGDFKGAMADINRVIENDNFETSAPFLNRGNLYMVFGMTDKAIEDYTSALTIDDQDAEAYYNRGLAFLILLDNASACADLAESNELGYSKAAEMMSYFCTN